MSTFDDVFDESIGTTSPSSFAQSGQKILQSGKRIVRSVKGFFQHLGPATMVGLVLLTLLVLYKYSLYVRMQNLKKSGDLAQLAMVSLQMMTAVTAAVLLITVTLGAQFMSNRGMRYMSWIALLSPVILTAVTALGMAIGYRFTLWSLGGDERFVPQTADVANYIFLNETPSSTVVHNYRNTDENRVRSANLQPVAMEGAAF
jgi:hypothetical protein